MFKDLGGLANIAGIMGKLPKIMEEAQQLQQRLSQISVEGAAGGGMVAVKANAAMEITGCTLSDDAVKLGDKEMLEDLIRAAVNQALSRAKQAAAEETAKVATNLGLPANLPLAGLFGS